ncbi:GNAT family N-acetyltransferase [Streptomyces sp. HC44]|uniref:GNAT family N-acetyltransferase n=1 Tax=Streptomyces scabichelini TaxID=2711217 RepID=A0A6G4V0G8_9ACTN|nr:GNAT family N-acetyltransferase [Streptomyces scabichelini]NGO07397.1 GNAT family N-acetyltransferase [Streptomyces scabichelini]
MPEEDDTMRKDGDIAVAPDRRGWNVRPYQARDEPTVRDLIDADRLPGQPRCVPELPAAALQGCPSAAGWQAPARARLSVLTDADDRPLGTIAFLSWQDLRSGLIHLLHAREDTAALQDLVAHALAALGDCPRIEAFTCAEPGALGPGGLPRTHRAATHDVLVRRGFTGRLRGHYLLRSLRCGPSPPKLVADVFPNEFPPGHRLVFHEAAEPVAEIVVSTARDRTATVYWLETVSPYRHRGLGRKLLDQALALLAEEGATHVVAVVGTSSRPTGTSGAAPRLFHEAGFELVDELWEYDRLSDAVSAPHRTQGR